MPETDLIGTSEAVRLAGYSRRTLLRAIARGDLVPAVKLPGETGAYLFHRADVEALAKGVAA